MVSGGSRPGYGCGYGLGKTKASLNFLAFQSSIPPNQDTCCRYVLQRSTASTVHFFCPFSDAMHQMDRHRRCHRPCYFFARFVSSAYVGGTIPGIQLIEDREL